MVLSKLIRLGPQPLVCWYGTEEEPVSFQHTRQVGHHPSIVFQVLEHVEEAHRSHGLGFKTGTSDRRTNDLGDPTMGLGIQRPGGSRLEQNTIEASVDQCLCDDSIASPHIDDRPLGLKSFDQRHQTGVAMSKPKGVILELKARRVPGVGIGELLCVACAPDAVLVKREMGGKVGHAGPQRIAIASA